MVPVKKLALLGFGNAGQAFAKMLLQKHEDIKQLYGYDVIVIQDNQQLNISKLLSTGKKMQSRLIKVRLHGSLKLFVTGQKSKV